MKNKLITAALVVLGMAALSASGGKAADKTERPANRDSIEGTWQLTKLTAPSEEAPGFEEAPPGFAESLKISFKDGKMTFIPAEPGFTFYTYVINPHKEPKHLDWRSAEAVNKKGGLVNRSIYKIEGDKITIMFSPGEVGVPGEKPVMSGEKRPVGFDRTKCNAYEGKRIAKAE